MAASQARAISSHVTVFACSSVTVTAKKLEVARTLGVFDDSLSLVPVSCRTGHIQQFILARCVLAVVFQFLREPTYICFFLFVVGESYQAHFTLILQQDSFHAVYSKGTKHFYYPFHLVRESVTESNFCM